MPNIAQHQSSTTTKLLLVGDSGSGKTGALASLAQANYKVRILDLDNGLDVLKNYLTRAESPYVKANPKIAENVDFVTLTDPMKSVGGKIFPAKATVWTRTMNMLENWVDGETKYGKVTTWDDNTVLVIDSLSFLSTAAYYHHLAINGKLGADRTSNEWRRDIGSAQALIRTFLELIYDTTVKCNVVLTAHITFVNEGGGTPSETDPGIGYPSAIGRALSPHIPRYFNTVLLAKSVGSGQSARQRIYTRSPGTINVKSTAPLNVLPDYPLDQGLALYFKAVRGADPLPPGVTKLIRTGATNV